MVVRITQIVPETVVTPTSGKVRVTQVVPETVLLPTGGAARITHIVVETVYYRIPKTSRPSVFINS